ncbi:uncharacterized protein LOC122303876 [Carya illinoinensis]|uniref:uncharacterized protein LOC122303876 n=1 Tax=Carya illinoinensis TaxID=32201 RepID=UPI001C722BF6|nr:uncharacterized protein LOC122303876 [Carya illinoinensis]
MKLHELHPASSFSVAWYPIYRIPEGNFRASFLTFHSLGHLVHKLLWSDSLNKDVFWIVFPVLGLQSYNAQAYFEGNPFKTVPGPFKLFWHCMLSKPG